jgi:protein-tyrosine phosphatase
MILHGLFTGSGADRPNPGLVSYVDLHCHLLPGIDDGAATMEDTLVHAGRLEAEGVRDVACTPHVKRADFPRVRLGELPERIEAAQRAIAGAGLRVRLHPGGELSHEDALWLPRHELDLIAQGPAGARWLLLECPFEGVGDEFAVAARRLTRLGYGLLLAHPERSARLREDGWELLDELRAAGALLQVNVSSLLGNHGLTAQEIATTLVRGGLAYCLASDGHPGSREHTLQLGFHLLLRAGASSVQAWRLTQANPRFLLRSGMPATAGAELPRAA